MTDKQPKALWMADWLESISGQPYPLELRPAAAELRRLHKMERAFDLWIEKTEWVQESCAAEELGMHRADVMKQRIERLQEVNTELVEALKEVYETPIDEYDLDLWTKVADAIAKATGEQDG